MHRSIHSTENSSVIGPEKNSLRTHVDLSYVLLYFDSSLTINLCGYAQFFLCVCLKKFRHELLCVFLC